MGASAHDIPRTTPRRRWQRRRVILGAGLKPVSAATAEACDLVDDLRVLLHVGLIETTTDHDGTVRYRAVADSESQED